MRSELPSGNFFDAAQVTTVRCIPREISEAPTPPPPSSLPTSINYNEVSADRRPRGGAAIIPTFTLRLAVRLKYGLGEPVRWMARRGRRASVEPQSQTRHDAREGATFLCERPRRARARARAHPRIFISSGSFAARRPTDRPTPAGAYDPRTEWLSLRSRVHTRALERNSDCSLFFFPLPFLSLFHRQLVTRAFPFR